MTADDWIEIITKYVCPSIGCLLSCLMYLSPVGDLGKAIRIGHLGHLPSLPWAIGLTNCWGWTMYGYLTQNLFVMLANVPGLFFSIYLNHGAIKLQYYALWQEHTAKKKDMESGGSSSKASSTYGATTDSASDVNGDINSVSSLLSTKSTDTILQSSGLVAQEHILYPILLFWFLVSVYVGWFAPQTEMTAASVGILCNINLVFFYGVPIQILRKVITTRDASVIHRPTLCMTASNAGFWMVYGLDIGDPVIYAPNGLGFALGVAQVVALLLYPTRKTPSARLVADEGQALLENVVENIEEHIIEPWTPNLRNRKQLLEYEHPVQVLVPHEIRSAMIV